jgi:Co/Zn/Cd efflux system component
MFNGGGMECSYWLNLLISAVLIFIFNVIFILISIFVFPTIWREKMMNPEKIPAKLFLILSVIALIASAGGTLTAQLLCKQFAG